MLAPLALTLGEIGLLRAGLEHLVVSVGQRRDQERAQGGPGTTYETLREQAVALSLRLAQHLAGEPLAQQMAADPEFVRRAEEGWQALEQGRCRAINLTELFESLPPPNPLQCLQCGMRPPQPPEPLCSSCTEQNRVDTEKIDRLTAAGHTYHCAARQTWGDGTCECHPDTRGTRVPGGL